MFLASRTFRTFGDKSRERIRRTCVFSCEFREHRKSAEEETNPRALSDSQNLAILKLEAHSKLHASAVMAAFTFAQPPLARQKQQTGERRRERDTVRSRSRVSRSYGTTAGGEERASVAIANPANSGRVLRVPSASRRYKATGERRGESSGAFPFQIR